ncbi:hypothetical protein AB0890_33945 [Streptomyces sp. NPDC005406]|uniref:hypothetical protein n=1 Tax=Streptomyces sp. NPDC005406 TaxID=3155339 RepID=UPI0034548F8E
MRLSRRSATVPALVVFAVGHMVGARSSNRFWHIGTSLEGRWSSVLTAAFSQSA